MNIILVPESFTYSCISASGSRVDFGDEDYDPMKAVHNVNAFFGRIDGQNEKPVTLRVDCEKVRHGFWDRQEFFSMLREVCTDDVYMQATDWYSMTLGFLNPDDQPRVEERLDKARGCTVRVFPREMSGVIRSFMINDCGVSQYDFREIDAPDNQTRFEIRDATVAGLVEIKFSFTKPEDHMRPPVPLRDDDQRFQTVAVAA